MSKRLVRLIRDGNTGHPANGADFIPNLQGRHDLASAKVTQAIRLSAELIGGGQCPLRSDIFLCGMAGGHGKLGHCGS